jgi:hypothetical protein
VGREWVGGGDVRVSERKRNREGGALVVGGARLATNAPSRAT